jgi:PKHD-type hydroxylase
MLYEIEPRNNPTQELCAFWENFLTEEDINWILSRPEWLATKTAEVGGQTGIGQVDSSIRKSDISWLNPNQETDFIWKKITYAVASVNKQFFNFDLKGCYEPIQMGIYRENDQGKYDWHTDSGMRDMAVPRKLSMSLLLTEPSEFEGGDLQVKLNSDEVVTLEQKRGRAWFFPSFVLHRVTPVTKGIRRSLVLWVGGPPFK